MVCVCVCVCVCLRAPPLKSDPNIDVIFDTVMNYFGTQNRFEMKLKIDLELRFHDFEWSWTQLFIYV